MVTTKKKVTVRKSNIKTKPAVKQKINIHTIMLIDASGSMTGHEKNVIKLANNQIASQKENYQNKKNNLGKCTFQIGDFHDTSISIGDEELVETMDNELDPSSYRPMGGTPLWAAIAEALASRHPGKNDMFNIIVITDGDDTTSSSLGWNPVNISKLIAEKVGTDKVSIIACMPPGSRQLMERVGIAPGNITEWERSETGISVLSNNLTIGMASSYNLASSGQTCTRSFFAPDLDSVSVSDLKGNLKDVTSKFKVFKVSAADELQISDFFADKTGLPYTVGRGFYQLTKKEKVQAHKDIVVMHNKTKKLYTGDEARTMLNIPTGGDIVLHPNFNADLTVFIKSTSSNRKLVPGTNVLYLVGSI